MNDLPHLTLEAREDSQLPTPNAFCVFVPNAGFITTLPKLRSCV